METHQHPFPAAGHCCSAQPLCARRRWGTAHPGLWPPTGRAPSPQARSVWDCTVTAHWPASPECDSATLPAPQRSRSQRMLAAARKPAVSAAILHTAVMCLHNCLILNTAALYQFEHCCHVLCGKHEQDLWPEKPLQSSPCNVLGAWPGRAACPHQAIP